MEKFTNDSEYEAVYESFVKEYKSYIFSFSDTDLKQFIVTFEESVRKHIKNNKNYKNENLFTKQLINEYILYVLLRLTFVDFKFCK